MFRIHHAVRCRRLVLPSSASAFGFGAAFALGLGLSLGLRVGIGVRFRPVVSSTLHRALFPTLRAAVFYWLKYCCLRRLVGEDGVLSGIFLRDVTMWQKRNIAYRELEFA